MEPPRTLIRLVLLTACFMGGLLVHADPIDADSKVLFIEPAASGAGALDLHVDAVTATTARLSWDFSGDETVVYDFIVVEADSQPQENSMPSGKLAFGNAQYSDLWGENGENWDSSGRLPDITEAGFMQGAIPIPSAEAWPTGVNVRDFGAVGDGVHDDSQALQDAIEACPPEHAVYLPNGVYKITNRIELNKNYVVIRGEDMYETVLKFPTGLRDAIEFQGSWQWAGGFIRLQGDRTANTTHRGVENLTFDFPAIPNSEGHFSDYGSNAIDVSRMRNSWIRNILIKNCNSGIFVSSSRYVTVTNIEFDNYPGRVVPGGGDLGYAGHYGVAVTGPFNVIHDVTFHGPDEYEHTISFNQSGTHNVISRIVGTDMQVDDHGGNTAMNYFTEINLGEGTPESGRSTYRGDHPRSVWWNIAATTNQQYNKPDPTGSSVIVGLQTANASDTSDPNFWHETKTPQLVHPQNIYLAQLEKLGKPSLGTQYDHEGLTGYESSKAIRRLTQDTSYTVYFRTRPSDGSPGDWTVATTFKTLDGSANLDEQIEIFETNGSTTVAEGGATDTYTVALNKMPSDTVTVNLLPDAQVSVSPITLTFTTLDWATPKPVTVTAVDDDDHEFTHIGTITHTTSSAAAEWTGLAREHLVTVLDNDNNAPVVNAGDNQTTMMRESQPWTPGQVSLTAWYDAGDLSTLTDGGGLVSEWRDKSGNGYHVTQSEDQKKPETASHTLNGLNVLDWDGTDGLENDGAAPQIFPVGVDVFAISVLQWASETGGSVAMYAASEHSNGFGGPSMETHFGRERSTSTSYTIMADGNTATFEGPSMPAGSTVMLGAELKRTTVPAVDVYLDGTHQGSSSHSTAAAGNAAQVFQLGAVGDYTSGRNMNGLMGELILVHDITTDSRQTLEGYLAHKWGLVNNLPSNHPFKNNPPGAALATITLNGSATDEENDPLSISWTQISGPEPVTFADASDVNTEVFFSAPGIYVLRLSADDGYTQTTSDVTITVTEAMIDSDNDGLDDDWETTYFPGQEATIDGTADSDGDLVKDYFEYLYGSDPTDPLSSGAPFEVVTNAQGVANVITWQVKAGFQAGVDYEVRCSTALSQWDPLPAGNFTLTEITIGDVTTLELILSPEVLNPAMFVRLEGPSPQPE